MAHTNPILPKRISVMLSLKLLMIKTYHFFRKVDTERVIEISYKFNIEKRLYNSGLRFCGETDITLDYGYLTSLKFIYYQYNSWGINNILSMMPV